VTAFTEADVQLVAQALGAEYWTPDERAESARAILTALADAGRLTPAPPPEIAGWPVPSVFMQWKGTDLCADFHCTCGAHGHVHGDFVYGIRCSSCAAVFIMPHTLALALGEPDSDIVRDVDTVPWVAADGTP
jgi:hypothetical protein